MNISEEEVKVMETLEGANPHWGMKAKWIATELYGPMGRRKRLRDGHEIVRAIQKLGEEDLIKDVGNSASDTPAKWVLTDKGRNLLEEMKG